MVQDWKILIHIAKKTGLFGKALVTTTALANELNMSQQTSSRKLKELDQKYFIKKQPTTEGFEISLQDRGREELKGIQENINIIFRGRKKLEGKIITGLGEGRFYTEQKGYKDQFKEKLGFTPYPGTLNLKSDQEKIREFLNGKEEIEINGFKTESRTFGDLKAYPVKVHGEKCAIVLPKRSTHPPEIVEILAPFFIRGRYGLNDGDKVIIR